jgi:TRAP-type C4-dicarboxylate transport system substrate-binding protein
MEQLTGEPITGVYDVPFLFSGWEHLSKVTQSDLGRDIESRLLKKGLRVLGYANEGTRAVYTRNVAIRSVADLTGVKIRVMQNPTYIAMYRALGAQPVPMSWAEVYTSLQTGVIDGVDASLNAGFSDKHIELSKFATLLGNHVVIACPVIVSERWWQSLPPDIRSMIDAAVKDALRYEMSKNDEFQNKMKAEWTKAGVTFTEPSREDLEKAVAAIYPAIEAKIGADVIQRVRALK